MYGKLTIVKATLVAISDSFFYYLTVDCKNQFKLSGNPKVITMFIYEESLFNNSNCCVGNHHDKSFLFKL